MKIWATMVHLQLVALVKSRVRCRNLIERELELIVHRCAHPKYLKFSISDLQADDLHLIM